MTDAVEREVADLSEKLNLLTAGERLEVVLRAQQDTYCATVCLLGTVDESLAYIDAAVSDLKAIVRAHHAWYNSAEGQRHPGVKGGRA